MSNIFPEPNLFGTFCVSCGVDVAFESLTPEENTIRPCGVGTTPEVVCLTCKNQYERCCICTKETKDFIISYEGRTYCNEHLNALTIFACDSCNFLIVNERPHFTYPNKAHCSDCFFEDFFYCGGCGNVTSRDEEFYSEDNDESYCRGCYPPNEHDDNNIGSCQINQDVYKSETFKNTNRIKRLYGVEIESINSNHVFGTCLEGFEVVEDGSVNGNGEEFRSGILQGDKGLELIENQVDKLKSCHYKVDTSCGLHVHIDARDLTKEQLLNITSFILAFESIIYSFLPRSRQNGTYCLPLTWSKRDLDAEKTSGLPRYEKAYLQNINRYRGFNLQAYPKHGTIEFRYHSGTIDYEKIQNWINLCLRIVEYQKDIFWDRSRKFSTSSKRAYALFYSTLQLNAEQIAYWEARKEKFNAVVLEGQPAIAEEN